MFARCRAYTLVELMVVLAIVGALAAIIFPVFASVKGAANKTVCASHFRSVGDATMIYLGDYDDRFPPISYFPGAASHSSADRTWVQLVLPYATSFAIFLCPSDTSRGPNLDATFDQDLVPGDLYSKYYTASHRVNSGLNYMALSPVVRIDDEWHPMPRSIEEIADPAGTVMFVDSVWALSAYRQPEGGGNWLVEPPCRYEVVHGKVMDEFAAYGYSFENIYAVSNGWSLQYGNYYGGVWPWHMNHMNVARADGSVKTFSLKSISFGCDLKADWNGDVTISSEYSWAPN